MNTEFLQSLRESGKNNLSITMSGDTEYVQQPNYNNQMITTQLSLNKHHCTILEHPTLDLNILPTWHSKCILSDLLGATETIDFNKKDHNNKRPQLIWEVKLFFAPADILAGLFNDRDICLFIQKQLQQTARIRPIDPHKKTVETPITLNLNGKLYDLLLQPTDYSGVSGKVGLFKSATGLGVTMSSKTSMDDYKTNMLIPYTANDPRFPYAVKDPKIFEDFLHYAAADAMVLHEISDKVVVRKIDLMGVHNLEKPDEIVKETLTIGSTVNNLLSRYTDKIIGDNKAYELSTKLIKNPKKNTKQGRNDPTIPEKIEVPLTLKDITKNSGVDCLSKKHETTKQVLSLVHGGLGKNFKPEVFRFFNPTPDVDYSGAYVSILRSLYYPIGLPASYGIYESTTKEIRLGEFLKRNKHELERGCFVIVVSGYLPFHQNLVTSKEILPFSVNDKINKETLKIPAPFQLAEMEIMNGIITSDILDVIDTVASNPEKGALMRLTVVSAIWFPKSKMCLTPEEWNEKTKEHIDKFGNSVEVKTDANGKETIIDNRSRYWFAMPLDDFFKPYADKRKEVKKQMKGIDDKKTDVYKSLHALQDSLKLVGNTGYGVTACPTLEMSNVVVANNTTAGARVSLWCAAVALNMFLGITDGGPYDINNVRFWRTTRPSFNTLALLRNPDRLTPKAKKSVVEKPLFGDGSPIIIGALPTTSNQIRLFCEGDHPLTIIGNEENWGELDELALDHVRYFFRKSNDDPTCAINVLNIVSFAHKDVYSSAVFHGQANYRFTHYYGFEKIKARGHKCDPEKPRYNDDTEVSNMFYLLDDISKTPQSIPDYPPQTIASVLKINEANKMLVSKNDNVFKVNNLIAGDTIIKNSWVRPISVSMFCFSYVTQRNSWEKKAARLKEETGYGLEHFFFNDDGTVNYEKAVKVIQSKIDDGDDWIIDDNGKNSMKIGDLPKHPFYSPDLITVDEIVEDDNWID